MIATVAYAQPAIAGLWYKGSASLKGYEIGSQTDIAGKDSGKGTIYVNTVADTGAYTVTTRVEDMNTDNVWNLTSSSISTNDVYGIMAEGETVIWDFFNDSAIVVTPDIQSGPYILYPMMTAKISKSSVSFKSFACGGYNFTLGDPPFGLGACTISFKSIENLKVPIGCLP